MDYQIIDIKGKETGNKISLDKNVFGIESNDHVVYLAIKQYMANNRQGTHKSKQRSEIIGSTRKIKKQKGTGTARAGSIKSPLFRGGGRAFGPNPRNYSFKLNKKVKKLAKKSVLSMKFSDKNVIILGSRDLNFWFPSHLPEGGAARWKRHCYSGNGEWQYATARAHRDTGRPGTQAR